MKKTAVVLCGCLAVFSLFLFAASAQAADKFGSTACRREVFQEVGLLDPSLCQSEDTEWFMRAQDYGAPRIVLEGISLIYRIHDQGITAKEPLRNKYLLKAFHLAIRRRKGEGAQGSCDERKEDRDEK